MSPFPAVMRPEKAAGARHPGGVLSLAWTCGPGYHGPSALGPAWKSVRVRAETGLVQTRVTVWVGGSGKAAGFAQALPMADKQDHRQAPKTALAAATRSLLPERTVS